MLSTELAVAYFTGVSAAATKVPKVPLSADEKQGGSGD